MINLEIPAINVLSKVDLISKYGTVEYDLDYYTELPDMTRMLFSVDRQNLLMCLICSQNCHCNEETATGEAIQETTVGEGTGETEEVVQNDEEAFVNRPKDPFQQKYRK